MNDRTLKELAAKAAGIVGDYANVASDDFDECGNRLAWDPLQRNSDALSLVVKLELHIGMESHVVSAWHKNVFGNFQTEQLGADPYAATRRAIVRAAAAIGETK